jgi:GTPase SAR1 family protein
VAILVGNKSDRSDTRMVSTGDAAAFAGAEGMAFFETSAKTGDKVADIFQHAAQALVTKRRSGSI